MASDLQRKKASVVFTAMDVNGDGFLERADFEALTERWARIRGEDGSTRLREIMMRWWDALSATADENSDQRITQEEMLAAVENLGAMLDLVTATAESMFEAVDEDGDGRVTAAEYARMIQAWTGREAPTDLAFARLDLNGDGELRRSEFVTHWVEFWVGDDGEEPGTHLFGEA
ncbi:EF-hand domain-containing protein [Saccharopolyspora dendranthemae]|uniref:Ca2+-binding EF-hand superfamily protein n=1 Tax=Saccharopolyspora dendranthemae TaxID=1181886 RepID=A0A561U303_9PSEU|nr:EF-hand domain-containing protein [Saccharopolyspora dendranthemae]TWF93720.1 Ca2+-binding EF-hand superfamily protein [Saccharopolyspora dendranthemae]